MQRTHLSLLGLFVFVAVLCLLALSSQGVQASHLAQVPPTDTPVPPTDTPQPPTDTPQPPTNTPQPPTDTPQPPNTPQPPTNTPPGPTVAPSRTPIGATSTLSPAAPTRTPVPGGSGGGIGPGPAATPVVNGCAQSVGRNGISLSTLPGFYQDHVQIVPRGHVVQVVGGPERADAIWWWLVRTAEGVQGWGNQDDMLSLPGPCGANSDSPDGSTTVPWPVTILPPGEIPQMAMPAIVSQPTVPSQTSAQTPAPASTLPQTGAGLDWWFPALMLLAVMVVVGVLRRRLQAQPVSGRATQNDEPDQKH
jgi:LPXTG-motif cell wall-anchored protein